MLQIHTANGVNVVIRPVPLISITQNPIRNKTGLLGSYYTITLNGTILSDEGSPSGYNGVGTSAFSGSNFSTNYIRPARQNVKLGSAMRSIVAKQNSLRELFAQDGFKLELLPASVSGETEMDGNLTDLPVIVCYPIVESINFEEGSYINTCRYTVTLRAEVLMDSSNNILSDGLTNIVSTPSGATTAPSRQQARQTITNVLNNNGGFIEDYSENWSIEVDDSNGVTNTNTSSITSLPNDHIASTRTYRLTRSINATGRTIYRSETDRVEAWKNARDYVYKSVLRDTDNNSQNNSTGFEQYPEYRGALGAFFASGFLDISANLWGGYNHSRTESIDVTAGTFTLNDTWLLSSGNAYENYNMSLSKNSDTGLHTVSINGTIKGLSSQHAGSKQYGGNNTVNTNMNTQYQNALYKYHMISNTEQYGPNCHLFQRAQSMVHLPLNHIPLSISLGSNPFTGEITYDIQYDTRLSNIVSGALSESISCSDTYPGDVFAMIPVIGRRTGPVLQYIGGRTEYQRSLSIDLTMDRYYTSGVGGVTGIRQIGILSKPSLNEPFKSQLQNIIMAYSPINEVGIRKYFASPPTETWDASSGRYSLQLNWTYEINR